jgi:hypothetical protein
VRVFLVPQVVKLMRKEHLPVASLCRTAREVVAGKLGAGEADLNGGLFKKRVARPGGGKSGGYRMIFAYAFAKNAAATLTPQGHEALVKAAGRFLAADNRQIAALLAFGDVNEMVCDGE